MSEPLVIKRRGENGNKLISVRIKEDTLEALDKLASETRLDTAKRLKDFLRDTLRKLQTMQKCDNNALQVYL